MVLKDLIGSRVTGKWVNTDSYVQCVLRNADSYWDVKRNRYKSIKTDVNYLIREKVAQHYVTVWYDCNRTRIQKFLDWIRTGHIVTSCLKRGGYRDWETKSLS